MGIAPPGAESTYGKRLRQYERRERIILWVGAGLVGLIALVTSDHLSAGAPRWLTAAVATLVIVGAALLATARIRFEWAATLLKRAIEDGEASQNQTLTGKQARWPEVAELAYLGGVLVVPTAGALYLAALWCAAT
jgi:hypothetical protein